MENMPHAPSHCIVCGTGGKSDRWNGLKILRCHACGLAWRAHFDVAVGHYETLHLGEDGVGETKAASRLRNAQDRLQSVKKFLPRSGIGDIGCGDGSFLSALQSEGYREYWGIEPSSYARDLAAKKCLDVVQGGITDLPLIAKTRAVQSLTLFHVIEHLPDPLAALETIAAALPAGGILVIETPNIEAAIQKVTRHTNALVYPEHLFYWTERALRKALEQAGFRVVAVTRRSFDWRNAPIRASLLRLGLSRPIKASRGPVHGEDGQIKPRAPKGVVRSVARHVLARLVHMLGRDDYILAVAERV